MINVGAIMKRKEMNELEGLNLSVQDLKRDLHDLVKEIVLEDVTVEIELKVWQQPGPIENARLKGNDS